MISQVAALNVTRIEDLWKASALLGLAHGSVFSLFPTICIEWFGMRAYLECSPSHPSDLLSSSTAHFSENWGFLSLAPVVGGNIFSIAFGRNLDAHEGSEDLASRFPYDAQRLSTSWRRDLPSDRQCLKGRVCYMDTLYMTAGACFVALLLSVWAGARDRKKLAAASALESREPLLRDDDE